MQLSLEPDRARRRWMCHAASTLAAMGTLGMGLTACGRPPMTVALHPWPGYAFMLLAGDRQWLDPSLVQLVNWRDATEIGGSIRQGQFDAAALTLDEVLLLRSQGQDLRVVAVLDVSVGADAMMAPDRIKGLKDLRGQRVGVESGAVGALVLNRALAAAGLSRADIQSVTLRQDQLANALTQGQIDVAVCYEPYLSQLEAKGYHRLFDSRALPDLIMDVLAVRPERARHAALESVIRGHFKAREAWMRLPIDVSVSLAGLMGVPVAQVASLYQGLNLPGLEANRAMLQPGGAVDLAARQLWSILADAPGGATLQTEAVLHELVVDRFLPARL